MYPSPKGVNDERMRLLLAAMQCEKGDLEGNLRSHQDLAHEAASNGCDFALFPEMSLTGSVDPTSNPERLISLDHPAIVELTETSSATGVGVCIGLAERGPQGDAHITQLVIDQGRCLGVQRKRHLGDGEESFSPAHGALVCELRGTRIAIAICAEAGFDSPFDLAAERGAQLVFFPAAPGLYGRRSDDASWQKGFSWWEDCSLSDARRHALRCGLFVALAGQAGSTVDEDFPGLAALVGPEGDVRARLPDWRAGTLVVEVPL